MERTVVDFREEIELLEEAGGVSFALIGGMACEVWAKRYLSERAIAEIVQDTRKGALTSKDLDARGTRLHALALKGLWSELSENVAFQEFTWKAINRRTWALRLDESDPDSKVVELTDFVPGVDTPDGKGGYNLRVMHEGIRMHVLDPLSLLEAKTDVLSREVEDNLAGLRNDFSHVRVLMAAIAPYLEELSTRKSKLPAAQEEQQRATYISEAAQAALDSFKRNLDTLTDGVSLDNSC